MHFSYSRDTSNKLREAYDFEGTPIKFLFNEKKEISNEIF